MTYSKQIVLLSFNLSKNRQSGLSDEEVVAKIVESQNPALISILYDRYGEKVFRKCMSFVKEPAIAEDLTHDIFIKVYLNLSSFKKKSRFSTWLYSITYNFCVDYIRKSKKNKWVSIEDQIGIENDYAMDNLEDIKHIRTEQLGKLLEKVKDEEKMILLMKYKDGMSIKEIQKALSISESAVKMRIKRAKEKVKSLHKKYFGNT